MRIWILTQYYPPEFGAVAIRLERLAKMLAADGHVVTVLTSVPNYPSGIISPEYRKRIFFLEASDDVAIHRVWVYASPGKSARHRLMNQVSFMIMAALRGICLPRPDVIYVESHPLFVCLAGGWLRRIKRAPVVLNVSDLWPESAVAVGVLRADSLIVKAAQRVEHWAYHDAAHIVGMTAGVCRGILGRRPEPRRVSLIQNAVDLEQFRPGLDAEGVQIRQRLRLESKFVAAHVGNMSLAHDFDLLLDVAEALPALVFVLAGGGSQVRYIEQQVRARHLSNVLLTGILPHADVPGLWGASDVGLVVLKDHSLFDGALPSKMFEAMAAGKPVVAAVRGEAEMLLRQTGAGIPVPPGDSAAMAHALQMLAASPGRRRQMGAAGRSYAEQHLSPDRVKEAYAAVFRQVM